MPARGLPADEAQTFHPSATYCMSFELKWGGGGGGRKNKAPWILSSERRSRGESSRGGGEAASGEGEALPEGGAREAGEEKGRLGFLRHWSLVNRFPAGGVVAAAAGWASSENEHSKRNRILPEIDRR